MGSRLQHPAGIPMSRAMPKASGNIERWKKGDVLGLRLRLPNGHWSLMFTAIPGDHSTNNLIVSGEEHFEFSLDAHALEKMCCSAERLSGYGGVVLLTATLDWNIAIEAKVEIIGGEPIQWRFLDDDVCLVSFSIPAPLYREWAGVVGRECLPQLKR